jgi:YD repeat-containing protein
MRMLLGTSRYWLLLVLAALAAVAVDALAAGVIYSYDQVGRVGAALYDNGMCVAYTYDGNGNRTSQINATPGAAAWGSGAWGCFDWTP